MKLDHKRTVLVGLAFLSICAFWQMYDNIIPLILTNTFHLDETISGAIMAADNVLALFLLPFFGALSDRTSTKIVPSGICVDGSDAVSPGEAAVSGCRVPAEICSAILLTSLTAKFRSLASWLIRCALVKIWMQRALATEKNRTASISSRRNRLDVLL